MDVATICLQTVIYISGRGFVHTYTLMNGRGYHMSTDCNLCKWAWLTKKKQSYAMTCGNTSTFNLARGVRPE